MKTQISFITDLFNSGRTSAEAPGESRLGEDLAKWLFEKIKGSEFNCGAPVWAEGSWELPVDADGEKFTVDVRILDESIGEEQADWVITVRKTRKWYGSKDSPLRHKLCDLLQNVLRDESQIREIGWED